MILTRDRTDTVILIQKATARVARRTYVLKQISVQDLTSPWQSPTQDNKLLIRDS